MPEALKLPQLLPVQATATVRADDQESKGIPAGKGEPASASFGEVLKSKSAASKAHATTKEPDSTEANPPQQLALSPTALSGLPIAPQLLAGLEADAPINANAVEESIVSSSLPGAEGQVIPATAMPVLALPAGESVDIRPDPNTVSRDPTAPQDALPAATGQVQIAAVPAPTLSLGAIAEGFSTARSGLHITTVSGSRTAPAAEGFEDGAAELPNIAGLAAKSAERGNSESSRTLPEPLPEFRPLLERLNGQADNIAMQQNAMQPAAPQAAAEPLQLRVYTSFAQTGWAQELEQKVSWIVTQSRQQADLVLTPPQLGRIEVSLTVQGDQINASFASPHQAVREAIEESLVRLRETLADSGISLGQTHVGRESSRDAPFMNQGGDRQRAMNLNPNAVADRVGPLSAGTAWQPLRSRGMVDVFA